MAEELRGVKVRIEIDTNKDTYELVLDDVDVKTARQRIDEFFEERA
jgi:hypothetical protein